MADGLPVIAPPVPSWKPDVHTLVGREREMTELTSVLDSALEGRGGIAMIAGEPGIGKTRLTEELDSIARNRGALVARGVCHEGGSAPPYWPWRQAIRSLLIEPSEAMLAALGTRAAVIAEIVPEINDMMPEMESPPELDPVGARFRLFTSVTSFLTEIAATHPIILILDDRPSADHRV